MTKLSLTTPTLHQVALRATDLERAARFWTHLLGSGPIAVFDPPGLAFFRLGETRLLLDTNAPDALIYLRVDSVVAAVQQLSAAGIAIESEPHVIFSDAEGLFGDPADEHMAFFRDSEGNLVGLADRLPADPDGD
ncbi:MAG: VOC family protein [Propionibacterium sp.]|nr:VOC family protein [Propionibacterium sp.]